MTGLGTVLPWRHRRDVRCVTHGTQPGEYAGCMKCGAGTVTTPSSRSPARARDEADDGWDLGADHDAVEDDSAEDDDAAGW